MAGTNEDVIRAVIKAWTDGIPASQAAIRAHFTDDCRWEQEGLPTTTGPEEAAQMMGTMQQMGFSSLDVGYRNVAAVGEVVFTSGSTGWCGPMGPVPGRSQWSASLSSVTARSAPGASTSIAATWS